MHNKESGQHILEAPQSVKDIEYFTDFICDNLYINDTYYGNILMSLTYLYEISLNFPGDKPLKISYSTDYQTVKLHFEPVSTEVSALFDQKSDIGDNDLKTKVFMIKKLTDGVDVGEDCLTIRIDIGALHNKVFQERLHHLNTYLTQYTDKVSQKKK
ncbi:MAG: hypothetical protein P8100_00165 [bacterium]|jgi:hypothetical protein